LIPCVAATCLTSEQVNTINQIAEYTNTSNTTLFSLFEMLCNFENYYNKSQIDNTTANLNQTLYNLNASLLNMNNSITNHSTSLTTINSTLSERINTLFNKLLLADDRFFQLELGLNATINYTHNYLEQTKSNLVNIFDEKLAMFRNMTTTKEELESHTSTILSQVYSIVEANKPRLHEQVIIVSVPVLIFLATVIYMFREKAIKVLGLKLPQGELEKHSIHELTAPTELRDKQEELRKKVEEYMRLSKNYGKKREVDYTTHKRRKRSS